jgi:peptidase E
MPPVDDIPALLAAMDVVWVGGGGVVNLGRMAGSPSRPPLHDALRAGAGAYLASRTGSGVEDERLAVRLLPGAA